MPLRLKRDVAYGGAVVFYFVGYRPQRYYTALQELADAFPSSVIRSEGGGISFKDDSMGADMALFLTCMAHTVEIEFNLTDESPDELQNLRDWWQKIAPRADYQSSFRLFVALLSAEVIGVWYEGYSNTRDVRPSAPVELKPEVSGEKDAGFMSDGMPS